jgi:hypothetical protein
VAYPPPYCSIADTSKLEPTPQQYIEEQSRHDSTSYLPVEESSALPLMTSDLFH